MHQGTSRRKFMQRLSVLGFVGAAGAFRMHARSQVNMRNPPPPPPAPAGTTWKTTIVTADEPGDRLVVSGQVYAPDAQHVVPAIFVYAYNTDTRGYYAANGDIYPPRLCGYIKTDIQGKFELHTIHPGRYPGMLVPSHIHFTLWGAGFPVQWVDELRFDGDTYLTEEMRQDSERREKFATIQALTRGNDGVSRCHVNLLLQDKSNFPGQ